MLSMTQEWDAVMLSIDGNSSAGFLFCTCFLSCPKALYHLESDNLFRITVVVADWLGWNPYHRSSFCTLSDWLISKFKLIYRWNFLLALLEWRSCKLIRRYFQWHTFVAIKWYLFILRNWCHQNMHKCIYLMVLVQNKYKNILVSVLRTQITFVTHSSPSCYVTLRNQVIRLNSGYKGPQKTDSGVFIIIFICYFVWSLLCF